MTIVGSVTSSLQLARSTQSQSRVLPAGGAWQVVYTLSGAQPFFFVSGEIDLSNMQAGDVIDIRVRKQLLAGGAFVLHDQLNYTGAQPAGHLSAHIGPVANVYGVEVAMRQTGGVLRQLQCEFYDAKRLGL